MLLGHLLISPYFSSYFCWPQAFGLHGHEEEEESSKDFIWKGCVVLGGIYLFFLLEIALHGLGSFIKKVHPQSLDISCTKVCVCIGIQMPIQSVCYFPMEIFIELIGNKEYPTIAKI